MKRLAKAAVAAAMIGAAALLTEIAVKGGCLLFLAVFSPSALSGL